MVISTLQKPTNRYIQENDVIPSSELLRAASLGVPIKIGDFIYSISFNYLYSTVVLSNITVADNGTDINVFSAAVGAISGAVAKAVLKTI